MVMEDMCEKLLEEGMVRDRVMAVVFVLEEVVLRLFCRYGLQNDRS